MTDRVFRFTVIGQPRAWKRPQSHKGGRHTHPETALWENRVAMEAAAVKPQLSFSPLEQRYAIALHVLAVFAPPVSRPKWWHRRLAQRGLLPCTCKPDFDNIAKGVADSLKGVAWHDDAQVFSGTAETFYGIEPRTEVMIVYLPDPDVRHKTEEGPSWIPGLLLAGGKGTDGGRPEGKEETDG